MFLAIRRRAVIVPTSWSLARFALPLCACLVLLLSIPLVAAEPANLTSDESLYLAEAYNIAHGDGFTYPSGDPITHRAPLFPALVAPFVRLGGPDAAYVMPKAIVIANALLVMMIAWRWSGAAAAVIAGGATAASAYLNGLGTTLYLDPLECTFMLMALLAMLEAARSDDARWFVAAGAILGGSFLVKEAAVQWLPLGIAAWLATPSLSTRAGLRAAVLFTVAFAGVVAPWWLWVWMQDSRVYLLGDLQPSTVLGALTVTAAVLVPIGVASWTHVRLRLGRLRTISATVLLFGWGALVLYALENAAGWKASPDYWWTVPRYMLTIAPQAQPYVALVVAWLWLLWRGLHGDEVARLLLITAALFAPFVLHAASRDLQLRDALPLVYLSYLALGLAGAHALGALRRVIGAGDALFASSAIVGAVFLGLVVDQLAAFQAGNDASASVDVRYDSWDSSLVRDAAQWMEQELPAGSRMLSSRLYFSSLYVHTEARFPIRQLPTVRVDIAPGDDPMVVPRSNLFRWGDRDVRGYEDGDTWLSLKRFPGKDYWVGLSQQELIEYITAHRTEYLLLAGEDLAFSSLAYADYFDTHPAFTLLYERQPSPADGIRIYRVDLARLAPIEHVLTVSAADAVALIAESGMTIDEIAAALATPVRVTGTGRTNRYNINVPDELVCASGCTYPSVRGSAECCIPAF